MKNENIEISKLTKVYRAGKDTTKAVDTLSFSIKKGEIFGLVGPNGAGKTTTIKLIVGLLKPDHGTIRIFGKNNKDIETKKSIGYLPENTVYLNYLNGKEFLEYMGRLYKIEINNLRGKIHETAGLVGIMDYINKKINTYGRAVFYASQ